MLADKLGVLADKLVVQKEDFDRRLEMMKSKQEMVLLKQDQLQSTLHGETGVQETPPVFTTPPPLTPRLSLSTHSIPIQSHSEVASALESCDLESLLSNISAWSTPEVFLQPPPKMKLHEGTLGAIAGSSAVGIPQQGTLGSSIPQQGTLGSSAVGFLQQGTLGSSAVGIPQQGTLGSSAVGIPQQGTLGSSAVGIPQQGTLGSSAVGFPQQGTLGSSVFHILKYYKIPVKFATTSRV